MVTQQEVIKKFVESLDKTNLRGTAAVDEAVKACSSFTSYSDLMEHFLADRNNASSGDDFLKRYCGINLDNADTGAITGADAGGSVVKTAESIVPESGSGKSVYPPSNSFSYKGLTVNVPDASRLNDAQKNIVSGLYTWWLKSGLDLAKETYGISFENSDISFNKINIDFDMGSYSNLYSYWDYNYSGGKVTSVNYHINSSFYNIKSTDPNGIDANGKFFLDRVIGNAFTKMLLMAKINYEFELPTLIGRGLTELSDGSDDRLKNEIIELVNDTKKLSNFSILNSRVDMGIKSTDSQDSVVGYMLLRYLAKQETDPTNIGNVNIPADALEYNGHSYYLYSGVASTWEEAKEYCESLGGHLAVINNSAENTELFNYMKSKGYNSAYFGFSDAVKEGNWQWVDGSSVTYTNWANGEPNSENSNEDYAEFYYKFTDGKWNDGNFQQGTVGDSKVFICEWDTIKDSDNVENTLDNQTIHGTAGSDKLFNAGGNNVYIYGLEGDDEIGNFTPSPFSGKTIGKNVSLNGGKGDDEIYSCSPKDHIIYAAGDGNDTIFTYHSSKDYSNGDSLKIHLTSGKFKGAKIDSRRRSDVILSLSNGTVELKTSEGLSASKIPITVIDSSGKEFKFTGEYEVKTFEYKINAGETHTAVNHNDCSGELVASKNGDAFIEQGDTIKTDSSGNITEILISDKNHRITTPLNRSTQKNVIVKDPAGNTIAKIKYGITEIYWNGTGYVIEAVDKDAPLSVESDIDNVSIIGSNRADNITTNGKNAVIYSNLGNDSIISNGTGATIVGGKDDDTISGTVDTLNLVSGKIKNASLKGSDLIISIGSSFIREDNSHTITIKNAKDKSVNVVNSANKKISIKNSYAGDPKILSSDIEYLQTLFKATENNLYNTTAGYIQPVKPDSSKVENLKGKFLANFKNDLTAINGDIKSVPEDVFEQIATNIFTALESSKLDEYSPTDTRQWLSNVLKSISQLKLSEFTVKSGSDNYQVTLNNLIGAGSGTSSIVIKKNNKNFAELNWTDNPEHTTQVLDDYLKILAKLHENVWWNVITGLAKDIGGDTAVKYAEYAKSIITALIGGGADEVIDSIKGIVKSEFMEYISGDGQLKIEEFIKNEVPNGKGKYIVNAAKSFKSLKAKLEEIKSEFEDYVALIEAGRNNDPVAVYENFLSAYDKFVENETNVINNINGNTSFLDDVKNTWNDLVSNVRLSLTGTSLTGANSGVSAESQIIAVGKAVYVDEAGDIVDSDTSAVLSVKLESDTFVYAALTDEDQKIYIGTSKDKFNFAVNTFEGNDTITAGSSAAVTINSGAGNDSIKNSSSNSEINGEAGNDIIINTGKNVTVNGGSGNDKIYGGNDSDKLYGDAGNDSLYGNSGNDTLTGGAGNDTFFYETGNDVIADYVAGNDKIKLVSSSITSSSLSGSDVVLKTSNGNITVQNAKGKKITVIDKNGKETSQIYPSVTPEPTLPSGWKYGNTAKTNLTSSVTSAANVDLTQSYGTNVATVDGSKITTGRTFTGNAKANSIKGGTSADIINGNAGADTIYGGSGNDKIYGGNDNDKIYGDAGNDSLYGNSGNDTLTGGAGNDTFYYETGNDVIADYVAGTDKIKLVSSSITTSSLSGSNVVLKTSNGNITVQNAKGKKITVIDKNGKETSQIYPSVTPEPTLPSGWKYGNTAKTNLTSSVTSAANVDLTQSYGTNVATVDGSKISTSRTFTGNAKANSIKGGTAADTIYGNAGADVLYGGSGNDKIYGGNDNDKLYGDAGNDSLYGNSGNDTLTGGAGNDTFYYETGNDFITDYVAGTDKIKLVSSSITTSSLSGSDVVLKTSNGNITVQNAKGKKITVIDKNGKEITQVYPTTSTSTTPTLPSGWKYGNTAKTNMTASVSSAANVDLNQTYGTSVVTVDGSKVSLARTFTGNAKANSIKGGTGNDVIYGNAGADKLYGGSGNDKVYGGNDNDKLYGDAGNDSLYGNSGNDTLTGGAGNDTFFYETGNDVIADYVAGNDKIKLVSSAITSASLSGSDVVLKTSNGNINVQNAKGKKITVIDKNGKEITQVYPTTSTSTTPTLPSGWKYGNTAKTNMTASVTSAANVDLMQSYGTNVATVDGSKITTGRTFTGNAKANSIKGGTSADIIYGNAGADILYGGSGNDKIYGGNDSDKLYGDAGNDSLYGNSGNDTLTGGAGNDTFYYETGNDVIADYVAGTDKIKLVSSSITTSSLSGSDVVLKTSNGNITVQNAKGKKITVIDKNGKETSQIYPSVTPELTPTLPTGWKYGNTGKTNMTASVTSAANLDLTQSYGTNVATVDGSKITTGRTFTGNAKANFIKGGTSADIINGNAGADTIYGGSGNDKIYGGNDNDKIYGDAGNDSLYGNSGNDTLTGGAGNDTFYYETGNDVIADYVAGTDKIKLVSSSITTSSLSGSNVVLKTSNGNITVQNAKGKKITVIDKNGKETSQIYPSVTPELTPTLPTGWKYGNTGKTNMTASVTSAANLDLTQSYGTNVATVDGSKITTGRTFTGNAKANSIKGGKSADKISGGNGKDTIFGGAGNDSIYGGTDNDKLQGDAGNDSLNGGSGNDTLTGGAGSDIFIYESGNDVITDYKAGEDKIKLNPSAITSSTVKGSDVILTTSNGTLTVKATKDKVITFTDNNGKNSEKIFFASTSYAPLATGLTYDAKRTVLTASNKFTGNTIDLGEYLGTVTKVNASAVSQALSITGNGENNSIKGGKGADTINGRNGKDTIFGGAGNDSIYGGTDNDKLQGDAGNDTLNGGSGNDTLTGGAGSDIFIYESGNDVITDYAAGQDSIKVSGKISKVEYSSKNVIFKIGSGSLTVNNAKGKNITVINNNQSQIYSKTYDLLYDNNFVTDEFSIDSITEVTETNYSVREIEKAKDTAQICNTIVSAAFSDER